MVENINFKSKRVILSAVGIVIIAAVAVFWYWSKSRQAPSSPEASSLGGQIFEKTQNPLEGQVPDANPFKEQKNPFDTIYKNPFKR